MSTHQEISAALDAARRATAEAQASVQAATSSDVVPTAGVAADVVKSQMAQARAHIIAGRTQALEAQAAARAAVEAQKAELDRQLREMEAVLAPMREQVDRLEEAIWTMNLYLGRDEEITVLRQGTPAPVDTPIHVRQQVLAMDEETAAAAESGGIDARDIAAFDQWLLSDPGHLDQVLPEARGVVVLMARRRERDYGDPWKNAALNEANQATWWLVRNGENLYRMQTDFRAGSRLVPARDEFTSMFRDRFTGKPLEPGSRQWLDAEKAAGARERHFMRIALVLQGLIDRTQVFAPLPVPAPSLLSPKDYDNGRVVLIADDEHQLTTGRKPFYAWLSALNSQLRPGMRVMVTTNHEDWPRSSTSNWSYGCHPRISPDRAEYPRSREPYTIKRRGSGAGEWVFTYPRYEERFLRDEYGREELRAPKTPASCTIQSGDRFVLPLDLVDVATMKEYLAARTERHAYADMFPLLHAAIDVLEREAASEEPFRAMLAAHVAQAEGVDEVQARASIDEVVRWWKVGNKHFRALQGAADLEARASREILAERARRHGARGADRDADFLASALRAHPDALLVARRKDGTRVVLTPSHRRQADADGFGNVAAPRNVFVDRHEYTGAGRARDTSRWQVVSMSAVARWTVVHEGPEWARWNKAAVARDHLSDPQIDEVVNQVRSRDLPGAMVSLVAITYHEGRHGGRNREAIAWYHPGPVSAPERTATGSLGWPYLHTQRFDVSKTATGDVELVAGWRLGTDNTTSWNVGHNTRLDGERLGEISPPWASDARRLSLVWTDEEALARAQRDADAWNVLRQARSAIGAAAVRITGDLSEQLRAVHLEAARARYTEDFGDAGGWEDHARGLNIVTDLDRNGKWADALEHLVKRYLEDGRTPAGMTVAEAVAGLGEPLLAPSGRGHRTGTDVEEELPAEIAALTFPADKCPQDAR